MSPNAATGSKAAWQQELCDPWLHNVIQWPKTLRFGCPHPIRLLCGRTKVQHVGQYVRSIHTVVFRVFAPTTCVTSPFTAKHRSNLKPPESDDFAWDVLANRFLPKFKPLGRDDSVYDFLATHSQVDFPAARECSCRVGLPRKPVSRPISSHRTMATSRGASSQNLPVQVQHTREWRLRRPYGQFRRS